MWEYIQTETRGDFEYVLSIRPEESEPDWEMSAEEKAQILDQIDKGWLRWFMAKIEAKKLGITLSTQYIGGCCYPSVQDFITGGIYEDLIWDASIEADMTLRQLLKGVRA